MVMPGAKNLTRRGNANMVGGPAMMTHHITDDALHADGSRIITLGGVSRYLLDVGYEPHVVLDPFTGEARQLLEATSSGYALEHPAGMPQTNRQGVVNLQVEWFFTPGTVYGGFRFATLTDTPMVGLDRLMEWADSWGIPRVARSAPGDRHAGRWASGGHFGHFNAPGNSHMDPLVPIADILGAAALPAPTPLPTDPKDLRMLDFMYTAPATADAHAPEDFVFLGSLGWCGRLPFGDTLDQFRASKTVADWGRRSTEFHQGVKALADQLRFPGSR